MTDTFPPARIAELRALAEKATPGPWRAMSSIDESFTPGWVRSARRDGGGYIAGITAREIERTFRRYEDAEFAATARDALPRALDTIEAQAAGLAERDAEIARLREALTPFTTLSDRTVAMCVACGEIDDSLMMLDFRRARAALAKEPQT